MVVTRGPSLWKVPGTDGLVLAVASAVGSPSVSAGLQFRFPKECFVQALLVLVRPDAGLTTAQFLARSANVGLRVIDDAEDPMVTDTRGTLRGTANAPVVMPLLAAHGRGFAPFAIQRPVKTQRIWTFSFQNEDTANAITLAGAFLYPEGKR